MAQTKDFYAVLGVSSSAHRRTRSRRQYRKLAKKHHPDTNANDAKAAERFKEISEAYNVLGDAEKRKQYDEMRRLGAFGGFGAAALGSGARPSARAGARGGGGAGRAGIQLRGLRHRRLGGLGDLFSSMFGGGRARAGARGRAARRRVRPSRPRSRFRSAPPRPAARSRSSSR